jgi:hypothetical protein
MAGNRDKYTPAERAAWAAQQDRIRAAGGVKAYRDKLSSEIDKSLRANAPAPKAGHNSKRSAPLDLDVAGQCLSEAVWSPRTKTLAVTFTRTGDQYVYYDVPKSVAQQLDGGESFNALIKDGGYDYD